MLIINIAVCGDIHTTQYSSILRSRGDRFSKKLENIIDSINWFNETAKKYNCAAQIFLGDVFDKPELNAEESTAINDINWGDIKKYFLCGNHEMMGHDHEYSSLKILNLIDNAEVIDKPKSINIDNRKINFLPYILEKDRKPLDEYLSKGDILFSHNDIKDFQMGMFKSESGFSMEELENNADIILNGHLHNGGKVTDKITNVGILTGLNFSEDAFIYPHVIYIINLDDLSYEIIENPKALNFYHLDFTKENININNLKQNRVLTIKCYEEDIDKYKNIECIESRIIPQVKYIKTETKQEELSVDHIKSFRDFILSNIENSKELDEELQEVLK